VGKLWALSLIILAEEAWGGSFIGILAQIRVTITQVSAIINYAN
jgi:hypothetical protein